MIVGTWFKTLPTKNLCWSIFLNKTNLSISEWGECPMASPSYAWTHFHQSSQSPMANEISDWSCCSDYHSWRLPYPLSNFHQETVKTKNHWERNRLSSLRKPLPFASFFKVDCYLFFKMCKRWAFHKNNNQCRWFSRGKTAALLTSRGIPIKPSDI